MKFWRLKAAHFLIAHMHGLGAEEIELFDKDGNQMDLDIMEFQNKITPERIIDSLNIFYNERTLKDKDHIAADLLIKHIDQAFDSWKNNLCSEILNFESFCEYLLPYRIDREPLEDWQNIAREQYHLRQLLYRHRYHLQNRPERNRSNFAKGS